MQRVFYPSNIDPQCQLSEIVIVLIKTYKWQKLNHVKNLELEVKLKIDLLIQNAYISISYKIEKNHN